MAKMRLVNVGGSVDDMPDDGYTKKSNDFEKDQTSEASELMQDDEHGEVEMSAQKDSEYEYVTFRELISPYIDKLAFWANELKVFLACIIILVICVLVFIIGNMTSAIFIVGALIILSVLFAIVLYSLWQNKKKAEQELRRAEMLYESSQKILSDHIDDEKQGTSS